MGKFSGEVSGSQIRRHATGRAQMVKNFKLVEGETRPLFWRCLKTFLLGCPSYAFNIGLAVWNQRIEVVFCDSEALPLPPGKSFPRFQVR